MLPHTCPKCGKELDLHHDMLPKLKFWVECTGCSYHKKLKKTQLDKFSSENE